jgi:putative OPT family oligopeptide transporter
VANVSKSEAANANWSSTAPLGEFRPYVPEAANVPEFTFKAVLFGAIFGIIFGAVTVYVGLRAGLTVSASIPIAVLSISLLRAFGKATILENNIVQTAGSAGESVAAGAIFTLPALIFMGFPFEYSRIFLLALIGGWIGVLFMIPLRRQLIVQEHGNLLYPEGTACADVLVAGEKGGSFASRVFWGLGLGGAYTFLMATAQMWKQRPLYEPTWLPGASFRAEITSEYLGVGYIIGPRIAGTIFAGGVFSWLVLMPAIKFFGEGLAAPLYPSTIPIANMTPGQMWENYIRPMGAGAVAMAGLITLAKTMPTIVNALRSGIKDVRAQQGGADAGASRLDRDLSMRWVLLGSLAIIVAMWAMLTFNPIAGARTGGFENLVASLCVVCFGFLFVTVSSRICGLIGTSANPVSGMTIATLMATCAMFLAMGWTAPAYSALAITIGGVVCVAAANAGATSQDLKTGYIVGATPRLQQIGLMIGVVASVFAIGGTLFLLHNSGYGPIGSDKLPAPQPTLIATIIKGILGGNLQWAFVLVGAALAVMIQVGISALAWAVGAYLPLSTTMPIFVGGLMRLIAEKMTGEKQESEISSGMLYSTGLVAGGSIGGVLIAALSAYTWVGADGNETNPLAQLQSFGLSLHFLHEGWQADVIAVLCFAALGWLLVSAARKKIEA